MKNDDFDFELDSVLGELGLDEKPSARRKNEPRSRKSTNLQNEKSSLFDSPLLRRHSIESDVTEPNKTNNNLFGNDDLGDFGSYIPSAKGEENTQRRSRFKYTKPKENDELGLKTRENSLLFDWDLTDKRKEKETTNSFPSFLETKPKTSILEKEFEKKPDQEIKLESRIEPKVLSVGKEEEKREVVKPKIFTDDKELEKKLDEKLNKFEEKLSNLLEQRLINLITEKLTTFLEQRLHKSLESSFKIETEEIKSTFANEIKRLNESVKASFAQEREKQIEDRSQITSNLNSLKNKLEQLQDKLSTNQQNLFQSSTNEKNDEILATLRDEFNKVKQHLNRNVEIIEQQKQNLARNNVELNEKFLDKMIKLQDKQLQQIMNEIGTMTAKTEKQNQSKLAHDQWRSMIEQRISFQNRVSDEQMRVEQKYISALRKQTKFLAEQEDILRSVRWSSKSSKLDVTKTNLKQKQNQLNDEQRSLSRLANEMKIRSEQLENMCRIIVRMRNDGIVSLLQLSKKINGEIITKEKRREKKDVCETGNACNACRNILEAINKTSNNKTISENDEITKNMKPDQQIIPNWWKNSVATDKTFLEMEAMYLKQLTKQ